MPESNTTTPLSGVDLHSLVDRLAVACAHMAPHHRDRQQGQLLIDCHKMLSALDHGMSTIQGAVMVGARITEQDGEYWAFRPDGEGMWGGTSFASMVLSSVNVEVTRPESKP